VGQILCQNVREFGGLWLVVAAGLGGLARASARPLACDSDVAALAGTSDEQGPPLGDISYRAGGRTLAAWFAGHPSLTSDVAAAAGGRVRVVVAGNPRWSWRWRCPSSRC
jgi:hypothetical protein